MDLSDVKSLFCRPAEKLPARQPFLIRSLRRRFPRGTKRESFQVHVNKRKENKQFDFKTIHYKRSFSIKCPLCSKKQILTREKLWSHLLRKHADFHPEFIRTVDGRIHFLLNKHPTADKLIHPRRSNANGCKMIYWARNPNYSAVTAPNQVRLPDRQYYHASTRIPKSEAAWLLDLDSDDEMDDSQWVYPISCQEIDDYTDVTDSQKQFFKIWNHFFHKKSDGVELSVKYVAILCLEFAQRFAKEFAAKQHLEQEFISHLHNLWDEGQVGKEQIVNIMTAYHQASQGKSAEGSTPAVEDSSDDGVPCRPRQAAGYVQLTSNITREHASQSGQVSSGMPQAAEQAQPATISGEGAGVLRDPTEASNKENEGAPSL